MSGGNGNVGNESEGYVHRGCLAKLKVGAEVLDVNV